MLRRLFFVLALAVLAAPAAARDDAKELPPGRWPDAEAIERFLETAKVVERVKIGEGITNPEKVTLELDGVVRHAVFKKVDKKHDSWRCEVAAYRFDKLLELGMVPPTVERSIRGRKGCLQLWIEGVTMAKFEGTPPDLDDWRRQVSVMWLFDDLIANIDRHLNNVIVTPDYRIVLIDNSKTFRSYRDLINDLNGPGTGTHARFWLTAYDRDRESYPTRYPSWLIDRIRALTKKDVKRAIGKYIWGYDRDLVLERREVILARLEAMGPRVLYASRR